MSSTPDDESCSTSAQRARAKTMGFWEHVSELRGTLIKSAVVLSLCTALVAWYWSQFMHVVMWPFDSVVANYPELDIRLGTTGMMEGVNMSVQICLLGGLMIAAPFILLFIGQFVSPALTTREMKAVLPMCAGSCFLFLSGAAFGFYILVPSGVRVFIEVNRQNNWDFFWSVDSYFTLVTRMVLGLGALFQFPLLILLLTWLGLVSTAWLRKFRRHAIVVIFIISAVVTPSGDPMLQTLFAVPLCVLYEAAILLAGQVEKKRERSATAVTLALLALLYRPVRNSFAGGRVANAT